MSFFDRLRARSYRTSQKERKGVKTANGMSRDGLLYFRAGFLDSLKENMHKIFAAKVHTKTGWLVAGRRLCSRLERRKIYQANTRIVDRRKQRSDKPQLVGLERGAGRCCSRQ